MKQHLILTELAARWAESWAMARRGLAQRRAYAEHRMQLAIERILASRTHDERTMATKWAYAWRRFSRGAEDGTPPDARPIR